MNEQNERKELNCDDCGKPEGHRFSDAVLCPDCFQLRGSSCAGTCDSDQCDI